MGLDAATLLAPDRPEAPLTAARPETPGEALLVAVVSALAGVRHGDRVTGVGIGARTEAALLAASATTALVRADARVVVAGAAHDVPVAVTLLAPGGRLVALAADAGAARRVAEAAGLDLRHVEQVGRVVAWSAVRPLGAPTPRS